MDISPTEKMQKLFNKDFFMTFTKQEKYPMLFMPDIININER